MSRAVVRSVAAALLAALVAGCSTVPSSSPTERLPQVDRSIEPDAGIEARGPLPDASPEDIVRGFLDAAASPVRGHPVARQFLTPGEAERWSDTASMTVIRSDYAAVPTGSGQVELTASVVGTLDERGSFTAADGETLEREFSLEQDPRGQWRISDPPDGLIIQEPDFTQTHDQVDAYFLDPTGARLVPDPLFLISGEAQPTSLVERLIGGPAAPLAPGVTNPLGGASLRSSVAVVGQTATVDLTGIDVPSPTQAAALSGQLVWSLAQLAVRTVRITLDGQPLAVDGEPDQQTVDDWSGLDPDATPVDSVGHFLTGGALRTIDGQPAPGPAGAGAYPLVSASVSADPRTGALTTLAGVTGGPAATLLAGPYGGELLPVLTAASLTQPTVATTRQELWTVRDGREVIRLPAGGAPQVVDAGALTARGVTTAFQLSPDGVRVAAVVTAPGGAPQLLVGTVVRTDAGVALTNLRTLAPGLSGVAGVAWRSASTLMVLADDQQTERTVPWTVGVDGWDLTQATIGGLPSPPTAVAAAPSRQPLVIAGGNVWRLSGGRWVTLLPGSGPLPGDAPFYPL